MVHAERYETHFIHGWWLARHKTVAVAVLQQGSCNADRRRHAAHGDERSETGFRMAHSPPYLTDLTSARLPFGSTADYCSVRCRAARHIQLDSRAGGFIRA